MRDRRDLDGRAPGAMMDALPATSTPVPARASRGLVAILGACALVVSACTADPEPVQLSIVRVTVEHGDDASDVLIGQGQTVADALQRAEVEPIDGQLLAASSGDPIEPNGDDATIELDGRAVEPDAEIDAPATITVTDGSDSTEGTTTERRTLEPEGLPDALQYVQSAGKPGAEDVTVGVTSGEVVSRTVVTPAVPHHRATGPVLALTFDDGPDPDFTPQILDILESKGVTATFCQVGTEVEAHPELVQRIVDEGHQLCNHTEHHVEGLEDEPRETVEAEISDGAAAIEAASGEPAPFYRPPGGSLGDVIYEVAGEHDQAVLYWSIDPRDWQKPPADQIVATVVGALGPGGIILLHDGGGDRTATIEALPKIIDYARALGYTFTTPISGRPQVG